LRRSSRRRYNEKKVKAKQEQVETEAELDAELLSSNTSRRLPLTDVLQIRKDDILFHPELDQEERELLSQRLLYLCS